MWILSQFKAYLKVAVSAMAAVAILFLLGAITSHPPVMFAWMGLLIAIYIPVAFFLSEWFSTRMDHRLKLLEAKVNSEHQYEHSRLKALVEELERERTDILERQRVIDSLHELLRDFEQREAIRLTEVSIGEVLLSGEKTHVN